MPTSTISVIPTLHQKNAASARCVALTDTLVYCKAKRGRQTELAMHLQVTPQTLSNWLYRRKRPSLDKYLAFMEFATQNAAMEMPPRVRKLLNELEPTRSAIA